MKFTKILCLILALSMLLVTFVACNNENNNNNNNNNNNENNTGTETESESETEAEEEQTDSAFSKSGLEVRDYSGKTMEVWYSTASAWSPYPLAVTDEEANSGDIVYQAGYKRNDYLEDMLGILINYTPSETDMNSGDVTALRNMTMDNSISKYDIVMSGAKGASSLVAEGFYYDLNNSDYVHTTADYYEAQVNEQLQLAGKQYTAIGFYSVMNTAAIDVTWVNMGLLEDLHEMTLDELYDIALDGKWTLEQLLTLGKPYETLDANTGDYLTDRYSMILSSNYCQNIYFDLGGEVVNYNKDTGSYSVTVNTQVNKDIFEYIKTNITNNAGVVFTTNNRHYESFFAQSAPFLCCTFMGIWQFMEQDMVWATLPAPKMQESDPYRSYSDGYNMNTAGIPKQCADLDKAGYLYELFMCLSYDYVYPAYYEKCFGIRYQPQEQGSQVFDIVAHARVIDLANIYVLYGSDSINNLVKSKTAGVASTCVKINTAVKGNLKNLLQKLEGNE